ncbi:LysR family transcriptional regulator [Streptosporangium sp. NPDC000396]|uniref:LysR family transcriptional regulator n=1 Tax=Streptosporangium sp. NPDC000396 TaxID=3366185 RepID=UPI0036B0867A
MQLPDLNLLPALDALLREASVARAAERMHVSASAMSRTLTRLRRVTGDELLVPAGRRLVLTERARRMQPEVERALAVALAALHPAPPEDPAAVETVLTIRGNHDTHALFLPALVAQARAQAPGIRLRFLPEGDDDPAALRADGVDLDIGHHDELPPDILSAALGAERLVAVMSRDHPLAGTELTLERFAAAEQLTISRRGRLHDDLDRLLGEHGLTRLTRASTATSWAAALTALDGQTLAILPRLVAAHYARLLPLAIHDIPLDLPDIPYGMAWHRRSHTDPAHRWLRSALHAVALGHGRR